MKLGDEITYNEMRAIVTEDRGGYQFDLLVYGPNEEGQSPHIVRSVQFPAPAPEEEG